MTMKMTEALEELLRAVEEQTGVNDLCKDEPDGDAVSYCWKDGVEIPDTITFGMIRRARIELNEL